MLMNWTPHPKKSGQAEQENCFPKCVQTRTKVLQSIPVTKSLKLSNTSNGQGFSVVETRNAQIPETCQTLILLAMMN